MDIQGDSEEVGLSEIYSIITSRCKCEIDEFNEKKNKQILTKLRNFLPDKNTGNNLNEISEKKLFYIKFKGDYNSFNIKIDHSKNINNENFLFDILGSNYYNYNPKNN